MGALPTRDSLHRTVRPFLQRWTGGGLTYDAKALVSPAKCRCKQGKCAMPTKLQRLQDYPETETRAPLQYVWIFKALHWLSRLATARLPQLADCCVVPPA